MAPGGIFVELGLVDVPFEFQEESEETEIHHVEYVRLFTDLQFWD